MESRGVLLLVGVALLLVLPVHLELSSDKVVDQDKEVLITHTNPTQKEQDNDDIPATAAKDENEDEVDEVHSRVKRSPWGSRGGSRSRGGRQRRDGTRGGNRSRRSQRSSRGGYGTRGRSRGRDNSRRRSSRSSSWGSRQRTATVRTPPKTTRGGWWGGRKTSQKTGSTSKTLDKIQTGLDIAGMTPGVGIVPDAINAGIHLARGNKVGAATSVAAMVPGAGQAVTGTKLAAKAAKAVKSSSTKIDNLAGKATQSGKPYPRGKKTEVVKESKANYRQGKKAYKESVVTDKTVKSGVRVGKTADGRTVTLRKGQEGKGTSGQRGSSGSGKHGPTVEIKDNNGDITKVRLSGGGGNGKKEVPKQQN